MNTTLALFLLAVLVGAAIVLLGIAVGLLVRREQFEQRAAAQRGDQACEAGQQ